MNGKVPHNRDTFVNAETERDFRKMLYDILAWDAQCTQERRDECNSRITKLEKRKWLNSAASFIGGIVGGVIAVISRALLK